MDNTISLEDSYMLAEWQKSEVGKSDNSAYYNSLLRIFTQLFSNWYN
ncbi:MAG: hypothetical protein F6K22_11710 [Okeania sp. SIO2F4]|nr:hypothetical protein [Okeania sp. SIO2F4]NES03450.1 hypothetical protein [Okeania sp. SIO2F4]